MQLRVVLMQLLVSGIALAQGMPGSAQGIPGSDEWAPSSAQWTPNTTAKKRTKRSSVKSTQSPSRIRSGLVRSREWDREATAQSRLFEAITRMFQAFATRTPLRRFNSALNNNGAM